MSNTDQTPSLWSDIKAMERFPYAAAARLLESDRARDAFVNRAGMGTVSPYGVLRALAEGKSPNKAR